MGQSMDTGEGRWRADEWQTGSAGGRSGERAGAMAMEERQGPRDGWGVKAAHRATLRYCAAVRGAHQEEAARRAPQRREAGNVDVEGEGIAEPT